MKIDLSQLQSAVNRNLASCYVITTSEPLFLDEALNKIRQAAKTHGYNSRERFDLTSGFDWQRLECALQHDSLFADKKLVEFHLGSQAPKAPMTQLLQTYQNRSSVTLLISADKLTTSQMKSQWYRKLDSLGVVVPIWPLRRQALPDFIQQRLQQAGFQTTSAAIQAIAKQCEGNLLAIRQLIEKLTLLFQSGSLTLEQIQPLLHDQPNFDLFALGESALRGESERCNQIIARLKQKENASTLVLWALTREIRLLLTLMESGHISVWKTQQALYQQALKRMTQPLLYQRLQHAAKIDRMIKGIEPGNVWDHLLMLALYLANAPTQAIISW